MKRFFFPFTDVRQSLRIQLRLSDLCSVTVWWSRYQLQSSTCNLPRLQCVCSGIASDISFKAIYKGQSPFWYCFQECVHIGTLCKVSVCVKHVCVTVGEVCLCICLRSALWRWAVRHCTLYDAPCEGGAMERTA